MMGFYGTVYLYKKDTYGFNGWQALIDDAMKDLPIGMEEAKRCQERIIRLGWGLSFPTLKRLGDKPLGCLGA